MLLTKEHITRVIEQGVDTPIPRETAETIADSIIINEAHLATLQEVKEASFTDREARDLHNALATYQSNLTRLINENKDKPCKIARETRKRIQPLMDKIRDHLIK